MKTYLSFILGVLLIALTGCGSLGKTDNMIESSGSIDFSSSSEAGESSLEEKTALDESETDGYVLPKVTAENQAYFDKYLGTFVASNPFTSSFSENNFEFFDGSFVYSDLVKPSDVMEVPLEEVENTITQYFPISAEQIRKRAGIHDFNEDKSAYSISPCPARPHFRGVVTASEESGNVLTLTCDWYSTSRPDAPVLEYIKYGTSQTKIRIESDETHFYESNQFTKAN